MRGSRRFAPPVRRSVIDRRTGVLVCDENPRNFGRRAISCGEACGMFPCRACLDRATKRGCHEWSHASAHGHCASRRRRDRLAGTVRGVSLFQRHHALLPIRWVGGVLIPLAVWLSRGSIIARNLLVVVSIIGVLFWSYLALAAMKHSWSIAAMIGLFAAVSAYCLWALMFSKEVRAELDRRAMQ